MSESKKPQDDPAQSRRFIDMAREVEASEDSAAFERVFDNIVPTKAGADPAGPIGSAADGINKIKGP